jgi:hypothetical protein
MMYKSLLSNAVALVLAGALAACSVSAHAQKSPDGSSAFTCPFQVSMPQPSRRPDKSIDFEAVKVGESYLSAFCRPRLFLGLAVEEEMGVRYESEVKSGREQVTVRASASPLGVMFVTSSVREPFNEHQRCTISANAEMCLDVLSPLGKPMPPEAQAFFSSLRGPKPAPAPPPKRHWIELGGSTWLELLTAEYRSEARAWILRDLEVPNAQGATSVLERYEADCGRQRVRLLAVANYPRRHAEGEMMSASVLNDTRWEADLGATWKGLVGEAICAAAEAKRKSVTR